MPDRNRFRGTVTAALWLCAALPVFAQDTTTSIQTLIDAASAGGIVTVEGTAADHSVVRTYSGPGLTIDNDLTLSGDEEWRPDRIVISSTAGAALTIDNGADVTLENLTFSGPEVGIHILEGGTVRINRCYILNNGAEGIAIYDTALAVISNCSIVNNGTHGIFVSTGTLKTLVGQCTFLDNTEDAMRSENGTTDMYASLIDRNGEALTETGGTFTAYGCLVVSGTVTGVTETDPVTGVTPAYATAEWIGKLTADIDSIVENADLPDELADFDSTDFDGDSRGGGTLEVGADKVTADGSTKVWTECRITPDPVGKNQVVSISIRLGSLSFDEDLDDIAVYIVPEFSGDPLLPMQRVRIPEGDLTIISSKRAIARHVFQSAFHTDSVVTTPLLTDGRAHVYLHDLTGDEIYGLDVNESEVDEDALDNSDFLIDTTPPLVGLVGTNTGDGRAHDFIIALADDLYDGDTDGSVIPVGWEPAAPQNPQGLAPASGARMFMLNSPGVDRRNPRIFFNLFASTGLSFQVRALFVDGLPTNAAGTTFNVETAGFPALSDLIDAGDSVATAISLTNPALFPTEALEPRWTIPTPDRSPLTGPNATATVAYAALATNTDGFPTSLEVTWTLAGLDYFENDVLGTLYNNDWNAEIAFRAYDRAGTESEDHSPIEVWWMATVAATITSNRYNGSPAQNPTFTWDLVRDESPGNSEPCVPLAKFRIYKADNPGDLVNTTWSAISPWSQWASRTAIDRTSIINNAAATTLGSVIDDPVNQQNYLLIAVAGADEAGNVQPTGIGNTITLGQLCTNGVAAPCASVTPGLCNQINGTLCNRIDFDIWQNEGLQALVQTDIQSRFWNNLSIPVDPGINDDVELRIVQAGERDYGSSTRVPLTRLEECDFRIEGAFGIQTSTPVPGAHWQIYEDGRIVAEGDIAPANGDPLASYFELVIPTDLLAPPAYVEVDRLENFLNLNPSGCNDPVADRLGDDGDGPDEGGSNRRRSVNYLVTGSGVLAYNAGVPEVYDPTPAAVRFTVYPEEDEFRTEQPVKSFTRE